VTVVSNTSPITNLAAVNQLNLLQQLYGKVIIPEAVYIELTGTKIVPGTLEVQTLEWIEVRSVTNPNQVFALRQELDPGEAEAIGLALELNADRLLIDERRGRVIASRFGIKFIGVLGILVIAKQRGFIQAVRPILDEMMSSMKFRVSGMLYTRILQDVSESE
jgi:predicted nucleic acid-binding protein